MNVGRCAIGLAALAILIGGTARGAEDAEGLKKKRGELRARQDAALKEMAELRRTVEQSAEMAGARAAVAEAKQKYDAKVAASAKVAEAKRAVDEANAKAKATADAEMAADPRVAAAQKELAAAEDAAFELDSQHRIAEYVLSEMRRKAARDHGLDDLRDRAAKALEAVYAAKQGGQDVAAAQAGRAAAQKAFDDAVSAKLNDKPEGAAQVKKIAELAAAAKEARAAADGLHVKWVAARAEAGQSNEKIVAARRAAAAAYAAQRKVAAEEAGAEKAALDKATAALDEAVRVKLDADPTAVELRKTLEGLRAQISEIGAQIKADAKAK